jgi:hypothetical protein
MSATATQAGKSLVRVTQYNLLAQCYVRSAIFTHSPGPALKYVLLPTRSPIAGADPIDTSNPTPSARIHQTDEHRSLPKLPTSSPNPLTRRLSRLVSNLVPTHRVCQVEEPR